MSISFKCLSCNRKVSAPDKAAGRKLKCPKCGQLLTVPGVGAQAKTAKSNGLPVWMTPPEEPPVNVELVGRLTRQADQQPASATEEPNRGSPEWESIVEDESSAESNSNLRSCPDCDNMVSKRANQCPNCGCPLALPPAKIPRNETPKAARKPRRSIGVGGVLLVITGILAIVIAFILNAQCDRADITAADLLTSYQSLAREIGEYNDPVFNEEAKKSDRSPVYFAGGVGVFLLGLGIVVVTIGNKRGT